MCLCKIASELPSVLGPCHLAVCIRIESWISGSRSDWLYLAFHVTFMWHIQFVLIIYCTRLSFRVSRSVMTDNREDWRVKNETEKSQLFLLNTNAGWQHWTAKYMCLMIVMTMICEVNMKTYKSNLYFSHRIGNGRFKFKLNVGTSQGPTHCIYTCLYW